MDVPPTISVEGLARTNVPDISETNTHVEHAPPSASTAIPPLVDEAAAAVLLSRFRNSGKISRRHSTQLASGLVHPILEATRDEPTEASARTNKLLRRSSTRRGLTHASKPWALTLAGLSKAGANLMSSNPNAEDHQPAREKSETPYEEMVIRFQIRQLQRTASGRNDHSVAGSASSSHDPEVGANTQYNSTHDDNFGARSVDRALEHDVPLQRRFSSQAGDENSSSRGGTNPPGVNTSNLSTSFPPLGRGGFPCHEDNADPQSTRWNARAYHETLEYVTETLWHWQSSLMTPISPYSVISQARYVVILMASATYVVFFPLGFAFPDEQQFTYIDATVGIILTVDVLFTLHTSYVQVDGTVIDSHRNIARHYFKTRFALDALFAIPLLVSGDLFGDTWTHFLLNLLSAERLTYVARFMRMIWLMRLNQSGTGHTFWAWLLYSRYSHLLRIAGIVSVLIAIGHYIACVWTVLLDDEDGFTEAKASWQEQYFASFYAALLLLQGEGVPTSTAGQNLFASLCVLVGSIVLAVVFGHVAVLVANFNASSTNYQHKREAVYAMTAKLQLPPSLRERIHEYYEHLWHEYECLDGEIMQFSKELSHTLGLEVVLFKYMQLVMHIPFWKDCTPDFQKQLMLRLDVRVYLPNDFIMREGEVDDEFYMVNRGYCELSRALHRFERVTNTMIADGNAGNQGFNTSRSNGGVTSRTAYRRRTAGIPTVNVNDGHRQSAYELDSAQRRHYSSFGRQAGRVHEVMVTRGQAFGDLALLTNYQRAANVRAITHVEMCVLSRESFQVVLTRYPGDRHRVVVGMLTSYMQSYEASQGKCPMLELVRSLYSAEAIAEVCAKAGIAPPLCPPVLTARQSAERIYTAINADIQDPTLKFGVGVNIREQLIDLRERRQGKHCHPRSILHRQGVDSPGKPDAKTSENQVRVTSLGMSELSEAQVGSPAIVGEQTARDAKPALSLLARLRQAEEREVLILRGLQELQADFKKLRDRQAIPAATPQEPSAPERVNLPQKSLAKRKRSLPENELSTDQAIGVPRPKLLQRMGSFVTITSGNGVENRSGPQDVKASPTRYADQLFQTHKTAPSSHQLAPSRSHGPRQLPKLTKASTFSMRPEGLPRLDTSDTSTTVIFNPPDTPGISKSAARVRRQRSHQRLFQRTHSQNLLTLAEGRTTHQGRSGSVGSSSTPPGRLQRRLSPGIAEPRESPTRYADALFRPRTLDGALLSTEVSTSTDQP